MSKLKNIEAIQNMLAGTHRTQTRKTFYFGDTASADRQKHRSDGEEWEEIELGTGLVKKWKKVGNNKVRVSDKHDIIEDLQKYKRQFINCPKETCTCTAPTRIDLKFKAKMGKCEECVVTEETLLKAANKLEYDKYANEKMKQNALSYFADLEAELEEKIKHMIDGVSYVNSDGSVDKWDVTDAKKVAERLRQELNEYKQLVMNGFAKKELEFE